MNMNRTMTMLVLLTALLVTAAATLAGLPAQEPNIWAPVGDLVGTMNHGTVSLTVLDPYGFEPKASEDWQLNDKYSGSLLFGWHTAGESGQLISLRSAGGSQLDGNTGGHLTFDTVQPGKWGFDFDYRGFDHSYDTTSEMRAPAFAAGPMPPALSEVPALGWNRARFGMKYHVNEAWHFDAGFSQMNRNGAKGSLLRGASGNAVPGVKELANRTSTFWVRGNYSMNRLAASLRFGSRSSLNDRSLDGTHTYGDDQLLWTLDLKAKYDVNPGTQVLAGGHYSRFTNDLAENYSAADYLTQNEAKTTAGQIGVLSRVAKGTTVRLTGQFKKQDTEALIYDDAVAIDNAMTRDRTSSLFQARLATTALKNARIQAFYKYNKSDLEEIVAQDALPGVATDFQATDQERTRNSAGLKLRYRFSRKASLKGSLGWKKTEITEITAEGADLTYKLGDRNLDQFKWQLALGLKPSADLRIDLGHQTIDQTYERLDEMVETNWTTQRGFVTVNWTAMPKLTVLASASLGVDKYELVDGPVAVGSMSPLLYEGTTLRYAPGVVYSVTPKLSVEAIYEGVDFEDEGDAADGSNKLNSDHMRLLLRAGYNVGEQARVTASYRRQEFDENRWDDYILDIYSLSVSGTF